MAATSTSGGMPPSAPGQLTSSGTNNNNNNNNNSDPKSTSASKGNTVTDKSAAPNGHSAKKLGKESGDQISCPGTEQQGEGSYQDSSNDNSSGTDDNNINPPRTRKGGLNQELREKIREAYQAKTVNLLVRYNKLGSQFADFANNVAFLSRCANMAMVPKMHRVYNEKVRNTRIVVRILDQCCYKVLMADLDHNRRRKYQVRKNRERIEQRLREIMSADDFEKVQKICEENKEQHFKEMKEAQRKEFEELMEEYKTNETIRRAERRGRRTTSSDQGSETGGERGYRDSKSAEPQPAPQVLAKAPPPPPKEQPTKEQSPKEQHNENKESNSRKQDVAQKTPKEAKAKTGAVGKDNAKDASSSKKQAPKESAAGAGGVTSAPTKKGDQKSSK